jgi:hypothetical protein
MMYREKKSINLALFFIALTKFSWALMPPPKRAGEVPPKSSAAEVVLECESSKASAHVSGSGMRHRRVAAATTSAAAAVAAGAHPRLLPVPPASTDLLSQTILRVAGGESFLREHADLFIRQTVGPAPRGRYAVVTVTNKTSQMPFVEIFGSTGGVFVNLPPQFLVGQTSEIRVDLSPQGAATAFFTVIFSQAGAQSRAMVAFSAGPANKVLTRIIGRIAANYTPVRYQPATETMYGGVFKPFFDQAQDATVPDQSCSVKRDIKLLAKIDPTPGPVLVIHVVIVDDCALAQALAGE